eukprot:SAG11_NODE_3892_length_2163_cov_0.859981_4_plen_45_part_00
MGILGFHSLTQFEKKFPRFVHLYLENSYWIYPYYFYRNFRQSSI